MEDALTNLFNLLKENIYLPIAKALDASSFCDDLFEITNNVINNFFRIFNSEKIIDIQIDYSTVSWILTLIILILIFTLLFSLFRKIYEIIEEAASTPSASDRVSRKIKKLKKKR